MQSIVLCEGGTDFALLQYFMRKVYGWQDGFVSQDKIIKINGGKSRKFSRDNDTLTIMSVGGCSRLGEGLKHVLETNRLSTPDIANVYSKIVIVTDNDDQCARTDIFNEIKRLFAEYKVSCKRVLGNNKWIDCCMANSMNMCVKFEILLLIIPFEEDGAMETFLLNALKSNDDYDKDIINHINCFVEHVDYYRKYLVSRRNVVKAKFDVYFSVRTSVEQFGERQNILKNIPWEEYEYIQNSFQNLGKL